MRPPGTLHGAFRPSVSSVSDFTAQRRRLCPWQRPWGLRAAWPPRAGRQGAACGRRGRRSHVSLKLCLSGVEQREGRVCVTSEIAGAVHRWGSGSRGRLGALLPKARLFQTHTPSSPLFSCAGDPGLCLGPPCCSIPEVGGKTEALGREMHRRGDIVVPWRWPAPLPKAPAPGPGLGGAVPIQSRLELRLLARLGLCLHPRLCRVCREPERSSTSGPRCPGRPRGTELERGGFCRGTLEGSGPTGLSECS